MKKLSMILCIMTILSCSTNIIAQKKTTEWLKTGTGLAYQVSMKGKQYNFIIKNLIIESNIAFDWEMTRPNELTGSLLITRYALDTATTQKNYFQDGVTLIEDKTAIWVSKKVFTAIKKKKSIRINTGNQPSLLSYKSKETFSFLMNGEEKTVKVLYAETNAAEKFWILDDPDNPLILKMDLGWMVVLKEANY